MYIMAQYISIIAQISNCFYHRRDAGSIPSSISSLSALVNLQLYTNSLTGEIHNIQNYYEDMRIMSILIVNIRTSCLSISNCQRFVGSIPSSISSLSALTFLSLYSNKLTGEYCSMHNCHEIIMTIYLRAIMIMYSNLLFSSSCCRVYSILYWEFISIDPSGSVLK